MRAILAAAWIFQAAAGLVLAGPYSGPNTTSGAIDDPIWGYQDGLLNPAFVDWAAEVVDYSPANPHLLDDVWEDASLALGEAVNDRTHVVSLGDLSAADIAAGAQPGSITLRFDKYIHDGDGADFGVFENGLVDYGGMIFAELAFVEVSTDGVHFARFDGVSLTPGPVGEYHPIDATNVYNLAGKHAHGIDDWAMGPGIQSWATPLDLAELAGHELVAQGLLSIDKIRYLRLVDIPGTGDFLDSLGNRIYDPHETSGSGGFDLEAVGLIHAAARGDIDRNGLIDTGDIDSLAAAISAGASDLKYDYNDDMSVSLGDLDDLLAEQFGSLLGDLDFDGVVGPADLDLLLAGYGDSGRYVDGDLTGDGKVDFADWVRLSHRYGQQLGNPEIIPEPSSLLLLAAGLICLRGRRGGRR